MKRATPSRILVAIDGSEHARNVVDAAVAYASAMNAELVALRVVSIPRSLPSDALAVTPDRVLAELVEEATESVRGIVGDRVPRIRVEPGTVVETIVSVADDERADLIVIGAHGYRFAERVLGTAAARIVDAATRSVLVVR